MPWDWKSPEDRFDKLDKKQREIERDWNPVPNEENILAMRGCYTWLRATLERLVEKEVFSDVIFRFRAYVDVKKLSQVVGFTQAESDEMQRLMQRCHDVTDAHDPPLGKHSAIPSPSDLAVDLAAARLLLDIIKKRRKTNRASAGATP